MTDRNREMRLRRAVARTGHRLQKIRGRPSQHNATGPWYITREYDNTIIAWECGIEHVECWLKAMPAPGASTGAEGACA